MTLCDGVNARGFLASYGPRDNQMDAKLLK